MRKTVSVIFLCAIVLLSLSVMYAQTPGNNPIHLEVLHGDRELRDLYLKFQGENLQILSSQMWTLTHAYESKEEAQLVLKYWGDFFTAIDSDNKSRISELGGAKGFKDKFADWLSSKDEAVRSFAAIILAIVGDRSYSPNIAAMIRERDASFNDRFTGGPVFYRGRAAVALGMLKADEYKADIAKLLKSKNEFDRSGAIFALSDLRAKEHTREIVSILTSREYETEDDDSGIHFLINTNQASKYKKALVLLLTGRFRGETKKTAAYALAAIGAREHSKDVARLLNDEFRKGTAAIVLALLGAKEYETGIVRLLNDKSSLVVSDAAVALGILGAKRLAKVLADTISKHEKSAASITAAEAIFLLQAKQYYPKATPIIMFKIKERPYPMADDFHPFVKIKIDAIRLRLEKELDSIKDEK